MKLKAEKRSHPITNIGSVSLLMTFVVLCLAIFAALSISGSISEYRHSQQIAQHTTDYYEASNLASEMLRNIDGILKNTYELDPEHYYETAEEQLNPLVQSDTDFTSENPSVTYEVPVDDTRSLRVVLVLNPPGQMEEGYYRITSWQEVPSSQWNGDDSLNLMTF